MRTSIKRTGIRIGIGIGISSLIVSALASGCGSSAVTGGSDGGSTPMPDMVIPTPPLGAAIDAPKNTWTWIDFPDSVCDDGTPTGIGVSLTDSKNVLVFLNGGGACWDYTTCVILNTSTHGPFGKAEFDGLNVAQANGSVLGRDAGNPFKDWNLVYVPYCTGDVHGGDNVATYMSGGNTRTIPHKGHANVVSYLKRLGATFSNPDKVVWSGSSAGGFGSAVNYDTARQYWPRTKMYLLDDSGPPLLGDDIRSNLKDAWFAAWGFDKWIGDLCNTCKDDLSAFIPILVKKYPNDRFALLSSEQDQTIRGFYLMSGTQFQTALYSMATQRLDVTTTFHYFFTSGQNHTMLGAIGTHTTAGVNLKNWITQFETDDSAWKSAKP